jgi:signal transduction histidine kinase
VSHSLRVRLPLIISTLIAISLVAFLAVSYNQVQRELVRAGEARALAVSDQLASLLSQSAQTRLNEVRRAARDPKILTYLDHPGEPTAVAARQRLNALAGDGQPPAELWDAAGRRLLSGEPERSTSDAAALPPVTPPFREGVSDFRVGTTNVYWSATAEIEPSFTEADDDVPARGYIVSRRILTSGIAGALSRLVGSSALITLGGSSNSAWSDLTKPVPAPTTPVRAGVIRHERKNGEDYVGAAAAIRGTPWLVLVQFPRANIVASANSYLWRMLIVATVLVVLAGALAHRVSAKITTPLHQLTASAEGIAQGRFEPVVLHRRDEIGRLAAAFSTMAAEVQAARQELEAHVAERTKDVVALNRQLEARVAELKALTTELESFSYSVSHDLRTPVRHIGGFSALLESSSGAALDEQGRRYVRTIGEAAARMGRLIDDLLAFSRMGRAEMLHTRVDLAPLVAEARREVERERAEGDIVWTIHPLPAVEGDPAMLRQVFANLLSNAVKYSGTRHPARIEVGTIDDPRETIVFVRDNGVGFDMQYASKLFGVFQRLHGAEAFEGTGIGLAHVRRIISRHGGRVWAESAPDAGATFFVALPKSEPNSAS